MEEEQGLVGFGLLGEAGPELALLSAHSNHVSRRGIAPACLPHHKLR